METFLCFFFYLGKRIIFATMKRLGFSVLVLLLTLFVCPSASSQEKAPTSPLGLFLKEKNYVAIQLKKFATGHLYLTAKVNDSTAVFILDTGAGATLMEGGNAAKYNLSAAASANEAVGAGGSNLTLQETTLRSFEIADYVLSDFKIHLMNLDHVNKAFKQLGLAAIDGVIGADILTKGKAVIDYEHLILYLKRG